SACVDYVAESVDSRPRRSRGESGTDLLRELLEAGEESRPAVAAGIRERLGDLVRAKTVERRLVGLEIGLHLSMVLYGAGSSARSTEHAREFWEQESDEIFTEHAPTIRELARTQFRLAIDCLLRHEITINDVVEWHGVRSLFRSAGFRLYSDTWTIPPASVLVRNALRNPDDRTLREELASAGSVLLATKLPMVEREDSLGFAWEHYWVPSETGVAPAL